MGEHDVPAPSQAPPDGAIGIALGEIKAEVRRSRETNEATATKVDALTSGLATLTTKVVELDARVARAEDVAAKADERSRATQIALGDHADATAKTNEAIVSHVHKVERGVAELKENDAKQNDALKELSKNVVSVKIETTGQTTALDALGKQSQAIRFIQIATAVLTAIATIVGAWLAAHGH